MTDATQTEAKQVADEANSRPKRINVAVNPDVMAAIDRVIARDGVTLSEAVRRLLTYGDWVHRSVKDGSSTVVIRDASGERELLII
jgi:hypothetical protein